MYNSQYVCQVDDICEMESAGERVPCYVLRPIYERSTTIRIPVDTVKVAMRELVSPDEARAIMQSISDVAPEWIEDRNERAQVYRQALRSGLCEQWVKLTKTLSMRKQEVALVGKKLSASDETLLKSAEKLLHGELAISLGIPIDEVQEYFHSELEEESLV